MTVTGHVPATKDGGLVPCARPMAFGLSEAKVNPATRDEARFDTLIYPRHVYKRAKRDESSWSGSSHVQTTIGLGRCVFIVYSDSYMLHISDLVPKTFARRMHAACAHAGVLAGQRQ